MMDALLPATLITAALAGTVALAVFVMSEMKSTDSAPVTLGSDGLLSQPVKTGGPNTQPIIPKPIGGGTVGAIGGEAAYNQAVLARAEDEVVAASLANRVVLPISDSIFGVPKPSGYSTMPPPNPPMFNPPQPTPPPQPAPPAAQPSPIQKTGVDTAVFLKGLFQ